MKRIALVSLLAALSLAAVSCGPSAYTMRMDTRYPSASGIDFTGKNISVVFLDNGKDSLFNCTVADRLASDLESDYFKGEQKIGIYRLPEVSGSRYSSRDTLASLIMELDSDVVILLDSPLCLESENDGKTMVIAKAYSYDSLGADTVKVVQAQLPSSGADTAGAQSVAVALGQYYSGTWQTESYTLLYYDWGDRWTEALEYAEDMEWDKAIELWMELCDTNDNVKRSCAEYDIALGCLIMGQPDLASEWLDRSDADCPVSLSKGLRKRINYRLGK
jgi:hypothetical protein